MEQRGPAACSVSGHKEGKDEMTKASMDLQDLRRRIYVKAKAETSWRFWGLYCPRLQAGHTARGVRAGQEERWRSGK